MAKPQPCLPITAAESHISSPFSVNVLGLGFFVEKREVRKVRLGFAGG